MEGGGENTNAVEGSRRRKRGRAGRDDAGRLESSKRDRCRREDITELYSKLRSMVPTTFPKAPRAELLQEAFLYIRSLDEERARLEKLKMLAAQVTTNGSSISVTLSNGSLAVFAITSSIRRNFVTNIISVFARHRAEILAANVVSRQESMSMTVTATVNDVAGGTVEKIRRDILMV